MKIKLCRTRQVYLHFKTPQGLRGFRFELSLAVSGPVDSDSGMILNLVLLDKWLESVAKDLQARCLNLLWEDEASIFKVFECLSELERHLSPRNVVVDRWELREVRSLRYIYENRKIYREDEQIVSLPEGPQKQVLGRLAVYSNLGATGQLKPLGMRLCFLDNDEVFEHGLCF